MSNAFSNIVFDVGPPSIAASMATTTTSSSLSRAPLLSASAFALSLLPPSSAQARPAVPPPQPLSPLERERLLAQRAPQGSSDSRAFATSCTALALEPGSNKARVYVARGVLSRFIYPASTTVYDGGFAIVEMRQTPHGGSLKLKLGDSSGAKRGTAPRALDCYHYYVFACRREEAAQARYEPTYVVVETLAEHRLPFDPPLLASMLQRELGFARKRAFDATTRCSDADRRNVSVDALRQYVWFADLYESCDYFVDTHLEQLERIWPRQELRFVRRAKLATLERDLVERPFTFCFSWLSGYDERVPELTPEQLVAAAPQRYSRTMGREARLELECVRFYALLKTRFHAEGHMYAPALDHRHGAAVRAFIESEARDFAEEHRILLVVQHLGVECVYSYGDILMYRSLNRMLREMAARPLDGRTRREADEEAEEAAAAEAAAAPEGSRKRKRKPKCSVPPLAGELTDEQKLSVNYMINGHMHVINAGPGRGKTFCGTELVRHYADGVVAAAAFMGLTADMLERRFGNGCTIDKMIQRIENKLNPDARRGRRWHKKVATSATATEPGLEGELDILGSSVSTADSGDEGDEGGGGGGGGDGGGGALVAAAPAAAGGSDENHDEALRAMRVLLLDEMSTLNVHRLERVLRKLSQNGTRLHSLVFLGDVQQNTSIDRGAIMQAWLSKYGAHAPLVSSLAQNHRVAPETQLILRNLERILQNKISEFEYSDDPRSNHPFLILHRPASLKDAVTLLAPFLQRRYASEANPRGGYSAQLLVQRNKERIEFNRLFFERDDDARARFANGGPLSAARYSPCHFAVGERIMFLENKDGSSKQTAAALRSNKVNNGVIARITAIEDVCVDSPSQPRQVATTAAPMTHFAGGGEVRRMIRFTLDNDLRQRKKQIATSHYALSNITRTHGITISKLQGGEQDCIGIYIHSDISRTFTQNDFFVAVSRACRRVVIICSMEPRHYFNGRNELEQIAWQKPPIRYECTEDWLPDPRVFLQNAIEAARREAEQAESDNDDDTDDDDADDLGDGVAVAPDDFVPFD